MSKKSEDFFLYRPCFLKLMVSSYLAISFQLFFIFKLCFKAIGIFWATDAIFPSKGSEQYHGRATSRYFITEGVKFLELTRQFTVNAEQLLASSEKVLSRSWPANHNGKVWFMCKVFRNTSWLSLTPCENTNCAYF